MTDAPRRRVDWGVLAVEGLAIFVSVLLGFGVAEWRDGRAEAERRDALLAAFAVEVADNREGVVERGTYHHWLMRQLEAGVADGSMATLPDIFRVENVTGFNPLALTGTAWATAVATGDLALLDFDTARALWALHDHQRQMAAEQDRMRALALDAFASADPPPIGSFLVLLREFGGAERELLHLQNAALARVAADRGAAPPAAVSPDVFDRDPFADAAPVAPAADRE